MVCFPVKERCDWKPNPEFSKFCCRRCVVRHGAISRLGLGPPAIPRQFRFPFLLSRSRGCAVEVNVSVGAIASRMAIHQGSACRGSRKLTKMKNPLSGQPR